MSGRGAFAVVAPGVAVCHRFVIVTVDVTDLSKKIMDGSPCVYDKLGSRVRLPHFATVRMGR